MVHLNSEILEFFLLNAPYVINKCTVYDINAKVSSAAELGPNINYKILGVRQYSLYSIYRLYYI